MRRVAVSGNVLFIIFIAIGLFAALSFAVSQNQSGKNASDENADVYAAQIINYADSVKHAVDRLRLKGCSDTQISFENTSVAGYTHSPDVQEKCKIFHANGGKVRYKPGDAKWVDNTVPVHWAFSGQGQVRVNTPSLFLGNGSGSGDTAAVQAASNELVMSLTGVTEAVCRTLNKKIGLTTSDGDLPVDNFANDVKFVGDYAQSGSSIHLNDAGKLSHAGCLQATNGIQHSFFRVLIVR